MVHAKWLGFMGLLFVLLWASLSLNNARAAVPVSNLSDLEAECPFTFKKLGRFKIQYGHSVGGGCFVSVVDEMRNLKAPMTFRHYGFYESGMLAVAVSVEGKDIDSSTGSRIFYTFPRKRRPRAIARPNGDVVVFLASGKAALFSQNTGKLVRISGTEIDLDPKISLQNRGGLEFTQYPGLLLDVGWRQGGMAPSFGEDKSIFVSADHKNCELTNKQIFEYFGSSEFRLRHLKDEELLSFLQRSCPAF